MNRVQIEQEMANLNWRSNELMQMLQDPRVPLPQKQMMNGELTNIQSRMRYLSDALRSYTQPQPVYGGSQNYGYNNPGYGYSSPNYGGYTPYGSSMSTSSLGREMTPSGTSEYTSKYSPVQDTPQVQRPTNSYQSKASEEVKEILAIETITKLQEKENKVMSDLINNGKLAYESVSSRFIIGGSVTNGVKQVSVVNNNVVLTSLEIPYISNTSSSLTVDVVECKNNPIEDIDITDPDHVIGDYDVTSVSDVVSFFISEGELGEIGPQDCKILDVNGDIGFIFNLAMKRGAKGFEAMKEDPKGYREGLLNILKRISEQSTITEVAMELDTLEDDKESIYKEFWPIIKSYLLVEYNKLVKDRVGHNRNVVTTFDQVSVGTIDTICRGKSTKLSVSGEFTAKYNDAVSLLVKSVANVFDIIKVSFFLEGATVYLLKKFKSFKCIINSDFIRELSLSMMSSSFVSKESYPELFDICRRVTKEGSFKSTVMFTNKEGNLELVLDVYHVPDKDLYTLEKVYSKL